LKEKKGKRKKEKGVTFIFEPLSPCLVDLLASKPLAQGRVDMAGNQG
jgi:hypothetical protein